MDITLCKGGKCLLKDKCFRYTAKGNEWQSYMTEIPWDEEDGACDYFMDNRRVITEEEIF